MTTREITEKLNFSNSTVHDYLKRLGFVSKLDIWIPHNLKETDLTRRITICDSLLKRSENDSFLKRFITGDEKWIVYNVILNVNDRSPGRMNLLSQHQRQIFIEEKLRSLFESGSEGNHIFRVVITSRVRRLIWPYTVISWMN